MSEAARESPMGSPDGPQVGRRGALADGGLSRRQLLRTLFVGGGAALLAGCQQAPATPASPAPGAAAAPAAPAAAAPAAWEQQWQELLTAARQEGRLIFGGPPSPDLRRALPAKFKESFGVEMEYLAFPPNQGEFIERLVRERAAGLYTVDVFIGGAQSIFTAAYPEKIMAPIRPALINPEALDTSKWRPGRIWFKDPDDMYFMQFVDQIGGAITVNTDHVRPDEIKSWRDLLEPRYTGRISVWNPTVPGTGWNTANWLRITLGDDYFKQLYVDQRPGIPEDSRQWGDWLARGRYPIAIGAAARDVETLKREGFPLEVLQPFAEAPGIATGAFGIVVLLANAPNPNAAKLFVNWMAMREGQETWGRADQSPVVRTDLDNSWAPPYTVPRPEYQYPDGYDWTYVNTAFLESIPKIRQVMALRG